MEPIAVRRFPVHSPEQRLAVVWWQVGGGAMELAFCAAAIFVVSAVVVYFVSVVGTRQKTYEEALAEARRRSLEEDAALQQARQHHKRDSANKKVKGRWGRTKVKESPAEPELSASTGTNETALACPPSPTQGTIQHMPEHVEFKEEAEVVLIPKEDGELTCDAVPRSAPIVPLVRNRRPQKPILVHKPPPEPEELAAQPVAPVVLEPSPKPVRRNSFKDIVPKDEIELKHLQEQLQQQQQQQQQKEVAEASSWSAAAPPSPPNPTAAAAKGSPLREKPPRSRKSKGQDAASAVTSDSTPAREVCARELLSLVRGSSRFVAEQEELEQLVEELLNRAGQPAGEWRKRGPDPEAHLRRLLAERERDLEAERQHALSHATKVKELRQELNQQLTRVQQQERNLKTQQKAMEEQTAQLQRLRDESRQLQQRVHQLEAELQQSSALVCERVRSREEELEQVHREALERERREAETRLAQAQQQAEALEATCAQLRQRLDQEAQNLAAQRNASEGKVKELSKVHQLELEAERVEHQRRLGTLEQRCQEQAHLAEELRTRLAEAVQTHSREVSELSRKKAEAEAAAEGAEQQLVQAHEAAVEELRRELDDQRAKNNDLRTKNWEAVEAMRAAERKAEAQAASLTKELEVLKASHTKDVESLQQRLLDEHHKKERELLERLLPAIKVDARLSHSEWLVHFEREVHQWQQKRQQQQHRGMGDHQPLSASTQSQTSGALEDVEHLQQLAQANAKLDKEVSHYKQVLSQTEDILQNLQRSVEEEEKRWHEKEEGHHKERLLWQQQLTQAQAEASQQKSTGPTEREQWLEERCAVLEADLRQLHGLQETTSEVCGVQFAFSCVERTLPSLVNEMQAKLKELQAKLQDEEGEKKLLEQKYDEVSRNAQDVRTHLESRVRELEEVKLMRDDYDLLKQELANVKAQLVEARRTGAKAHEEGAANHSPSAQLPVAKATPDTVSLATNGPSAAPSPAEKDDKLECSELGSDTIARPSGDAPCSKNTNGNRTKKRVRLRLKFWKKSKK
ncbi:ribosome-binding protein 1-like isoform X3 [Dermacentor albipictus]|uniref:ribosome-binding protein 1-like isoform X3 n=1 Tax=Dermacentor albipictus TaxID=60249 RepID=UPI0038FC7056